MFKFIGCLLLLGIGTSMYAGGQSRDFRLPEIPENLTDPDDRAAYLSLHYWDHFNFRDRSLVDSDFAEQTFVNFLSLLPSSREARTAAAILFRRASANRQMVLYLAELCDKYLYDVGSPMRSEDLYVLMLTALVECPRIREADKLRACYQLELADKNRPGMRAENFEVMLTDGSNLKMYDIEAPLLLVFFNDPDCRECIQLRDMLESSEILSPMLLSGQLRLFSVCVEGDVYGWKDVPLPRGWIAGCDAGMKLILDRLYALQSLPVLYLLDEDKRVILKDASFSEVEAFFETYSCPQSLPGPRPSCRRSG